MIIKGQPDAGEPGRTWYDLGGFATQVRHFVVRRTGPHNAFGPHRHEQAELWYVVGGAGVVRLGQDEQPVQGGDLIAIRPWVEHGLRTDAEITWICLG